MAEPLPELDALLGPHQGLLARTALEVHGDRRHLFVAFPGLPRRCGKQPAGTGRRRLGDAAIDVGAFRACDLAAMHLLLAVGATDDELWQLYEHGDIEERAMVLRSLHVVPLGPATVRLLGEVQRTNMVLHVEAAVCDGDLLARAAGANLPGFGRTEQNRLLLKLAFLDLPLGRAFDAERLANAELSRMLQDLATEREAAGRAVWRDTDRMLGRAPVPGAVARLLGGLEHGDDGRRLAAAEGLLALNRRDLAPFAHERLGREPREGVRAVLERITGGAGKDHAC